MSVPPIPPPPWRQICNPLLRHAVRRRHLLLPDPHHRAGAAGRVPADRRPLLPPAALQHRNQGPVEVFHTQCRWPEATFPQGLAKVATVSLLEVVLPDSLGLVDDVQTCQRRHFLFSVPPWCSWLHLENTPVQFVI